MPVAHSQVSVPQLRQREVLAQQEPRQLVVQQLE
jgi:hypothetical protein